MDQHIHANLNLIILITFQPYQFNNLIILITSQPYHFNNLSIKQYLKTNLLTKVTLKWVDQHIHDNLNLIILITSRPYHFKNLIILITSQPYHFNNLTIKQQLKTNLLNLLTLNFQKPTAVPARTYIELLFEWVDQQIHDESIFPTDCEVEFPKNFKEICMKILSRHSDPKSIILFGYSAIFRVTKSIT